MGGYGSTRWGWYNSKQTVGSSLQLNINNLVNGLKQGENCTGTIEWKNGCDIKFTATAQNEGWLIQLIYCITRREKAHDIDDSVNIISTTMPNGGVRYWFQCPMRKCSHRKVRKLYLTRGSNHFGCRTCHNLVYRSSQNSRKPSKFILSLGMAEGMTPQQIRRIWGC